MSSNTTARSSKTSGRNSRAEKNAAANKDTQSSASNRTDRTCGVLSDDGDLSSSSSSSALVIIEAASPRQRRNKIGGTPVIANNSKTKKPSTTTSNPPTRQPRRASLQHERPSADDPHRRVSRHSSCTFGSKDALLAPKQVTQSPTSKPRARSVARAYSSSLTGISAAGPDFLNPSGSKASKASTSRRASLPKRGLARSRSDRSSMHPAANNIPDPEAGSSELPHSPRQTARRSLKKLSLEQPEGSSSKTTTTKKKKKSSSTAGAPDRRKALQRTRSDRESVRNLQEMRTSARDLFQQCVPPAASSATEDSSSSDDKDHNDAAFVATGKDNQRVGGTAPQ